MADGGPGKWIGGSEYGERLRLSGRKAKVHKPLVAISKVCEKGNLVLLDCEGGYVVRGDSVAGRVARRRRQVCERPGDVGQGAPLYKEQGVYNFYLKDRVGTWQRFNGDTGAAETIFPEAMCVLEDEQGQPGFPRQAQWP